MFNKQSLQIFLFLPYLCTVYVCAGASDASVFTFYVLELLHRWRVASLGVSLLALAGLSATSQVASAFICLPPAPRSRERSPSTSAASVRARSGDGDGEGSDGGAEGRCVEDAAAAAEATDDREPGAETLAACHEIAAARVDEQRAPLAEESDPLENVDTQPPPRDLLQVCRAVHVPNSTVECSTIEQRRTTEFSALAAFAARR